MGEAAILADKKYGYFEIGEIHLKTLKSMVCDHTNFLANIPLGQECSLPQSYSVELTHVNFGHVSSALDHTQPISWAVFIALLCSQKHLGEDDQPLLIDGTTNLIRINMPNESNLDVKLMAYPCSLENQPIWHMLPCGYGRPPNGGCRVISSSQLQPVAGQHPTSSQPALV